MKGGFWFGKMGGKSYGNWHVPAQNQTVCHPTFPTYSAHQAMQQHHLLLRLSVLVSLLRVKVANSGRDGQTNKQKVDLRIDFQSF